MVLVLMVLNNSPPKDIPHKMGIAKRPHPYHF